MATVTYITPKFRCQFMNVFKAIPNELKQGNPLEFSVVALFPKHTDLSGLKEKWEEACKLEKSFGNRVPDDLRPLYSLNKDDKGMMVDGDTTYNRKPVDKKPIYEAHKGCYTARFSNSADRPPSIIDHNKDEILNVADFKSGDYARAVLELSSYTHKKYGPQVTVRLLVLQKLGTGEAFGGGISSEAALGMIDAVELEEDSIL